jgi:AcrR family transcriptional regulator
MRPRDQDKQDAIFEATVKLVNEVGFAAASVSKIANEANVSPRTIYIYHENKVGLLISIYIEIKNRKGLAAMEGFDESSPLKESFRRVWNNSFKFVAENRDYLEYHDQFLNSPYSHLVDDAQDTAVIQPFIAAVESAVRNKVIKEVDFDILSAFMFSPITALSNPREGSKTKMTRKNIDTSFEMAWDAIKL